MMPGMGGMDPRQVNMMMKKLGIDVKDIADVQEVVIRTKTKEYVFRDATVSVMKAQGVETWQVSGKPTVAEPSGPAPIPEGDVKMVMDETGCDEATARKALTATEGDIAEAIVRLAQS